MAEVLHVWFARDKGANYGFCEVASQEAGISHANEDTEVVAFVAELRSNANFRRRSVPYSWTVCWS